MSDTESKPDAPILSAVDRHILDRFESRVFSIEFVRSAKTAELRTIIHLDPKAGTNDA